MAKQRMINTKFWNDGWVRKMKPLERYLFLYLLSNEHTNICGIYELPIATIAFETGISEKELEKTMMPKLSPKVIYFEGWVILPNFIKHQNSKSPQVKIGIMAEIKDIPAKVIEEAIRYGYPMDTQSHLNPNPNLNSNPNISGKKDSFLQGSDWNLLIDAFEPLNPMYLEFYKMKTERNALDALAKQLTVEKLYATIQSLPEITSMPYAPKITKPTELKRDLGKLLTFYRQEKGKIKTKQAKVAFV